MAELTAAQMNDAPDSDFAYIEPGGTKDGQGRTVPRNKRHFYIGDAAHVRNALARASQSPFGQQAMPKIKRAAQKFGIDVADGGRSVVAADLEIRFIGATSRDAWRVDGYRTEVRTADGQPPHIVGYGAVFDRPSRNLGGFIEFVGTDAFNRAGLEGWPGAVCRYNHDMNLLLGTVGGNTLTLRTDNIGLFYDVLPPKSRADITELVERGDVRHSSFAFRVPPGGDEWGVSDQSYPMRTLHELELVDVAPVVTPAYPDATAGLRSLAMRFDASEEEVRKLAETDELRRFFIRTGDLPSPTAPRAPEPITGAAARMLLLKKRDISPAGSAAPQPASGTGS